MNPPPGIIELPGTPFWVLENDTHLSKWAGEHGHIVTDPHLLGFLAGVIPPRSVVYDIGANIGDHTFAYLVNGNTVIAFEPNPLAFACLVHNCPEAVCHNVAVSDADGTLGLTVLDNAGASRVSADGEWSVPAVVLDDMPGLPAPDFVKLDVEGFEPNVITGMAGTITRHRPIIFVEMNRGALEANGATPEALHDTILSLGYSRFELYPAHADWSWPQFDVLYLP